VLPSVAHICHQLSLFIPSLEISCEHLFLRYGLFPLTNLHLKQ
jgi:hypothetical protein